jgi:hypothetical protein
MTAVGVGGTDNALRRNNFFVIARSVSDEAIHADAG